MVYYKVSKRAILPIGGTKYTIRRHLGGKQGVVTKVEDIRAVRVKKVTWLQI